MLRSGHLVECTATRVNTNLALFTLHHYVYTLMATGFIVAIVTVHWNSIKLWRNKEMIRISFIYSHKVTERACTSGQCTGD